MTAGAPNFDRIARPYRALEYFTLGYSLERARLHFLPRLLTARNALVLGDGDGRFLAQLLSANPGLHATAVDTSAAMLHLLRKRCAPYADRLQTQHTDALTWMPTAPQPYDLVVTHFFLDCLTQPQLNSLVERITPELAPGAIWVISDFQVPANALRIPARLFIDCLYLAFRILTGLRTSRLPVHEAPLTQSGFTCIARQTYLGGLLIAELWQTDPLQNPS
ncbi:class I SAM-dependent methyltransferase [Edaphobacter aggregans]|uniref:class I SAM-dependent methyltransferase n=1 Tax=Edaphobacter aggregans TaxID=570835 RepID=UPI000556638B|nr:class I SAM-dependent methyltransferase [Edaphobacter aggregans]